MFHPRRWWLGLALLLPAAAQNPLQVDAPHFKLEYEDDRVRVLRFRLAPGEKSPLHEHAARITVVVTGSRLRIEDTEGAFHEINIFTGAAERQFATRHTIENVGDTVYEELTTEFKDAASQPPKLVVKAPPPPPPQPKPEKVKVEKAKKEPKEKPKQETASVAPPSVTTPSSSATAKTGAQSEPATPSAPTPETKPAAPADTAAAEPATPPVPEPIIKPLKIRPLESASTSRRARKSFEAESLSEASVNGTKLAFMDTGKGAPVILVHGAMGDYRSWQSQIAALSKSYRVISYSRRYHYPNPSTGKEEDYTFASNVKDLADFIAALNIGPVHLVGHGYGAAVATLYAKEHPDKVRSLVISEPGFENLLDEKRAYRARWARDEVYNIIRKPLTKKDPEKGIQLYHDWLAETEPWSRLDPQEQYERRQNVNALHAQTVDPNAPSFTCADAKKLNVPTLLVAGQNRSPNSAEITGTLAACLPNSDKVTISDTGPAAYLDNAKEYNEALLQFLAKH